MWTPTVLVLDEDAHERWRIEGYLPRVECRAELELGLARVAFMNKDWTGAEERYSAVLERHPQSKAAPEALYWKGVSHYKATNDHTVLGDMPAEFQQKYPDSVWALKTIPWSE